MHNILNNLLRSLILIEFHFGRAVSKLLAIRPVVAEITCVALEQFLGEFSGGRKFDNRVSVAEGTQVAATGEIDGGMVHPVVD
jgi:hypothetical protein